jgi:hypothetical protein
MRFLPAGGVDSVRKSSFARFLKAEKMRISSGCSEVFAAEAALFSVRVSFEYCLVMLATWL